jgi:hypothetical protein
MKISTSAIEHAARDLDFIQERGCEVRGARRLLCLLCSSKLFSINDRMDWGISLLVVAE